MSNPRWLADRTRQIEASGIRKIFELGKTLKDPVNLSIGQPHFPVPEPIREAAKRAIDAGGNGYTVTQGVPELRDRIAVDLAKQYPGQDRGAVVTSGTSGGLYLAMLATVNPGDEVVIPDPYFVSYPHLVTMVGGKAVFVDTYPDFRVDPDRIAAAITDRTKLVLLCSPGNPTGTVVEPDAMKAIADVCRKRGVLLLSDEIYRAFHFDGPPRSPAEFDPDVLVVEGFGKTYGVTGWRLGFAHGPRHLVDEMAKLQQFTFVCAPSAFQHAAVAAMDFDVSGIVADYRRKRDLVVTGLKAKYEIATPGGAFYAFPKSPRGTGTEFVAEAIRQNLLVIPGGTFSRRDTHFRISYAAADETLQRGIDILNRLS